MMQPALCDPHLVPPPGLDDRDLAAWLAEVRRRVRAAADLDRHHGRSDLAWYRDSVLEGFFNTFDPVLRDAQGRWRVDDFVADGRACFGGYDLVVLWQPYPRSGIDPRDQFAHWRALPGGIEGLRRLVADFHRHGVRCQLNYVPWDRPDEDHLAPLLELVEASGADGVYGDTMRGFPAAWNAGLERIRPGLALSSEGSPLPAAAADGLTGCWGQNLLPVPPAIPLVRFADGRHCVRLVDRDSQCRRWRVRLGLFWGMGHVVWENVFGQWNPYGAEDRAEVRRATAIHRGLVGPFRDRDWVHRRGGDGQDGVWVNEWRHQGRVVLTALDVRRTGGGRTALRLPEDARDARWRDQVDGREYPVRTAADGSRWLDWEPRPLLPAVFTPSTMPWLAPPRPEEPTPLPRDWAGEELNRPLRPTVPAQAADRGGMALVAGGAFVFQPRHYDGLPEGGCCDCRFKASGGPNLFHHSRELVMPPLLVERHPVTNADFARFLASGWRPAQTDGLLAHWSRAGDDPRAWRVPPGLEGHPVVHVDLDDARAYAAWRRRRLPTEEEWTWVAQGAAGRTWPWGDAFAPHRVQGGLDPRYFSDGAAHAERCRLHGVDPQATGIPAAGTSPVDAHPGGATPDGVLDLCGNVWEWTESERDDGHSRYALVKGGGWLTGRPGDSQWYLYRGPTPNAVHQKVPLLWPGMDRCATIGFRCVADR